MNPLPIAMKQGGGRVAICAAIFVPILVKLFETHIGCDIVFILALLF